MSVKDPIHRVMDEPQKLKDGSSEDLSYGSFKIPLPTSTGHSQAANMPKSGKK